MGLWEMVRRKIDILGKEEHDCSSNESVCQIMEKVGEIKEIVMKIQQMIETVPSEQPNIIPDMQKTQDIVEDVPEILPIGTVPSEQPNIIPDSVEDVTGIPPENEDIGTVPSEKPNMMPDMKEVQDGVEDFTGIPPENKDIETVPSEQPNIIPDMQTTKDSVEVVPGIPPENEDIETVPSEQPNIIPDMQTTKDIVEELPGIPPENEDIGADFTPQQVEELINTKEQVSSIIQIAPTTQEEEEIEKSRKLSECIQALLSACDQINVLYYQMKHKKEGYSFYIIDPSPSDATSRFTDSFISLMITHNIDVHKMEQTDDIKYTDPHSRVLVICSLTSRFDCNMDMLKLINPEYHNKIVLILLHCMLENNLPSRTRIPEAKKKYPNIYKVVEMAFFEDIYCCSMNNKALKVLLNEHV